MPCGIEVYKVILQVLNSRKNNFLLAYQYIEINVCENGEFLNKKKKKKKSK